MKAVADATIDRWFTGIGRKKMPEKVKRVKDLILGTSSEGFCSCCEAIRELDLREILPGIKVPTLVIVGALDVGAPVAASRLIAEKAATSELKIIPDDAHFVNVERADIFNELLLDFLKKHSA